MPSRAHTTENDVYNDLSQLWLIYDKYCNLLQIPFHVIEWFR